jgi:hypothetical protein
MRFYRIGSSGYFILKDKNEIVFFFSKDYIVPPQENNALFLMTNFIRTDQEHRRCPGIYRNKIFLILFSVFFNCRSTF